MTRAVRGVRMTPGRPPPHPAPPASRLPFRGFSGPFPAPEPTAPAQGGGMWPFPELPLGPRQGSGPRGSRGVCRDPCPQCAGLRETERQQCGGDRGRGPAGHPSWQGHRSAQVQDPDSLRAAPSPSELHSPPAIRGTFLKCVCIPLLLGSLQQHSPSWPAHGAYPAGLPCGPPSGHTETILQPFISSPRPPPTPSHLGASPHAPPLSPGPSAIPRIPP